MGAALQSCDRYPEVVVEQVGARGVPLRGAAARPPTVHRAAAPVSSAGIECPKAQRCARCACSRRHLTCHRTQPLALCVGRRVHCQRIGCSVRPDVMRPVSMLSRSTFKAMPKASSVSSLLSRPQVLLVAARTAVTGR